MRMAKTIALKQKAGTHRNERWLVLLCLCLTWGAGCFTRRAPVKPVVNFIAPVRPTIPTAGGTELQAPPNLRSAPREAPEIALENVQPAKPRVASPSVPEPSETEKPVPTIAPEVTAEEMNTARAATRQSLDVAEKGLTMAQGRKLNATQEDLASKVRGFADNAKEAMRSGDWERAKNLAKKAELLSQQLTSTF
jgi:hypothetical protein